MISNRENYNREIENVFPLFIKTTNDLIMIIESGKSFEVDFVNKCEFLKKLGYSYDKLVGTSFLTLIHPNDVEKITDFLKDGNSSKSQLEQFRLRAENGNIFWVRFTTKKFNNQYGKSKIFVQITDISNEKDQETKGHEYGIPVPHCMRNILMIPHS